MVASKRSSGTAMMTEQEKRIEAETEQLLVDIQRIKPEGEPHCLFGDLFVDPAVEQYYEALVGTLKAAKKKGLIHFDGQILFKGMHDNVQISILRRGPRSSSTPTRNDSAMTNSQPTQSPTATPTRKDCFTQTSKSSTKKTILTPSHLRNENWKNNDINSRKHFVFNRTEKYNKDFQMMHKEKTNNDLPLNNKVDSENGGKQNSSSSLCHKISTPSIVTNSVSITPDVKVHSIVDGQSKPRMVETHQERVDREISQLLLDIRRIEPKEEHFCSFGDLFIDEHVEQYYEALVGTLKAAKRKGLIHFQGQMLFKGMHDHVQIKIVE